MTGRERERVGRREGVRERGREGDRERGREDGGNERKIDREKNLGKPKWNQVAIKKRRASESRVNERKQRGN